MVLDLLERLEYELSIATTFGTASTGTAISALSGAAAQKAAVARIGRTFAGFAVEGK